MQEYKPRKIRKPAPPVLFEKYICDDLTDRMDVSEESFFYKLKTVLQLNSAEGMSYFSEFCACLGLYSECVITKHEFLTLVTPLFELTEPSVFLTGAPSSYKASVSREDTDVINLL